MKLWIVSTIALLLFVTTNLPWELDDYDQAKQAFTSFEMVEEGHLVFQRTPHERIATKPPLVGWISAGVYEVTRSWDVAWRLPSLAAAIALAILLWRAGNVYGTTSGLIALSAFAFNLLAPRLATLVRTDMPLALVVFWIGLEIWNHIRERRAWATRDRLSIFLLLTAAMLIKGPIVYAFLLPSLVVFQWARKGNAWCGWWPWLASLGVFLVWVIAGSVFVPNFYDQVVVREFLGRFGETIHRPQPIYFYLPHLLHKFAPWSLLLIILAILDFRSHRKFDGLKSSSSTSASITGKISPETWWLICWSLGGLIVMSLIPSKRVDRIFPVIPPLCLLVAVQIRGRDLRWAAAALCFSILFAGAYSAFKIYTSCRDNRAAWAKFGTLVRERAATDHWNYEVLESSDEGLLLYSQKLHFVKWENAAATWNANAIDALVVRGDKAEAFARELPGASVSSLRSPSRHDDRGDYVLITR